MNILSLILLLAGCVSIETLDLNDEYGTTNAATAAPLDKNEVVLFSKSNAVLSSWYSCVKDYPVLSMSNSTLYASLSDSKGQCFGIFFDPIDVTKNPILKVRAKFQSSTKVTSVDMLAGFTDSKKGKTYAPEKSAIIESGKGFTDYVFDYSELVNTAESGIDLTKVTTILIFINIRGMDNISGAVSIEEITLSKEAVKKPEAKPKSESGKKK